MERMPMWQIAIRRLEMPMGRFLALYVGGAFAGGFLASLLLIFITGGFAEGALFAGFSGILLLFLLPLLAAQERDAVRVIFQLAASLQHPLLHEHP